MINQLSMPAALPNRKYSFRLKNLYGAWWHVKERISTLLIKMYLNSCNKIEWKS